MAWDEGGLIEGFYGPPWSTEDRLAVMERCHAWGMTRYVYAPKDDDKHRARWREPYDTDELADLEALVEAGTLEVAYALSPGLSIDYGDPSDLAALADKLDQVVALGVDLVVLALDDIPNRPGLGEDHAALCGWLVDHLEGRADLALVPTEYVGVRSTPYLDALAAGVPAEVPIGWTGMSVVNGAITADEALARAASLGGRPPLLWDNVPVNDGMMSDRLHLGPLRGRDPMLSEVCWGYWANPMVQPRSSLVGLASIASWLRGLDPVVGWADAVIEMDCRVLAEACDGVVPQRLVAALIDAGTSARWAEAAAPLARWLRSARDCTAGALGDEAAPWVAQTHAEARLGLAALRALQAARPLGAVDEHGAGRAVGPVDDTVMSAFAALAGWPDVRRSSVTVMGPRCSIKPAIVQAGDGRWTLSSAVVEVDANATDALVRHVVESLSAVDVSGPVTVSAGTTTLALDADGGFTVPAGVAEVTVSAGGAATVVAVPGGPPLAERRLDAPAAAQQIGT